MTRTTCCQCGKTDVVTRGALCPQCRVAWIESNKPRIATRDDVPGNPPCPSCELTLFDDDNPGYDVDACVTRYVTYVNTWTINNAENDDGLDECVCGVVETIGGAMIQ